MNEGGDINSTSEYDSKVMRGFYGDQEDYSMDSLPPNARILIE